MEGPVGWLGIQFTGGVHSSLYTLLPLKVMNLFSKIESKNMLNQTQPATDHSSLLEMHILPTDF